jgi:drug/metabolite transporter (DMT)-like permease
VAAFATTVWLGLLVLAPIALFSGQLAQIVTAPPEVFFAAAYLGVGASVLAFCSWHSGIARVGAANAAIFMQLVPFFAVILSTLFLGETLHGLKLAGLIIITLCFLFTQFGWRGARHAADTR